MFGGCFVRCLHAAGASSAEVCGPVVLWCARRRYLLAVISRGCIATVPYEVQRNISLQHTLSFPSFRWPISPVASIYVILVSTDEENYCVTGFYFTGGCSGRRKEDEVEAKITRGWLARSLLLVCSTLYNTLEKNWCWYIYSYTDLCYIRWQRGGIHDCRENHKKNHARSLNTVRHTLFHYPWDAESRRTSFVQQGTG